MSPYHPDYNKVVWSCGCCGAPLNAHYQDVEPEGGYDNYNPDDYPHAACHACTCEAEMNDYMHEAEFWKRMQEEGNA
jgi:hypothetical protein